jgi:protein-disulfide isomerase
VVVEFSDFQCPYCRAFANETLPALIAKYVDTGMVLFAFRHFPLAEIHPFAERAGVLAECARLQNRFWEVHDSLFGDPHSTLQASIDRAAEAAKLDGTTLDRCMQDQGPQALAADQGRGRQAGVSGTPSFFVGTQTGSGEVQVTSRVSGAKTIGDFSAAIDLAMHSHSGSR